VRVKLTKYHHVRNEFKCVADNGLTLIDPTVGCAFVWTHDQYMEGIGFTYEGRWYEVPDDVHVYQGYVMLPGEGEMVEVPHD